MITEEEKQILKKEMAENKLLISSYVSVSMIDKRV